MSEDLPLTAIAVDTRPRTEAVLGPTIELNRTGLVTLERARLLTGGLPGELPAATVSAAARGWPPTTCPVRTRPPDPSFPASCRWAPAGESVRGP